jgi:hypothetical protein
MRHVLRDIDIKNLKAPGKYCDGGGLYLQISSHKNRTKAWIFRFGFDKRTRDMGLGPYPRITLKQAREFADKHAALIQLGIDPIEERRRLKKASNQKRASQISFEQAARKLIEIKSKEWTNAKHADQWTNTLETYAYPTIGKMPVSEIETRHVLDILEPIWSTKTETATRVRQRIASVLDWAKARKYRDGDNPASMTLLYS